ncbi:unnamed protein product [Candida verbasci]|uniref:High osmolarity signaling protein SHO1 n=1 Tax=Candida verbasci TaxID=1227364 RepID=A0A9W4TVI2_9ASCO|nr:unnamed protein product [Candida verbasci]
MGFTLSNFTGDPFAISTISFGIISWIVALAGAAASEQSSFPHFSWWGIAYQIVIILLIFLLYLNNNIELYKFTLVGLVSIAFIYTTNSTNNLIYNSSSSGNLCCAAGCILLSILNLIWILYFGGHPESPTNQFIDSFSLKNHAHEHLDSTNMQPNLKIESYDDGSNMNSNDKRSSQQDYRRHISPVQIPENNNLDKSTTNNNQYVTSSNLAGLENFSSQDIHRDLTSINNKNSNTNNTGTNTTNITNKRSNLYSDSEAGTGIIFRYKAKALYTYDANPDDINEISFVKDEILEVDDIDGKWWQARRANGQVGICPSNYVKLLDS